MRRNQIYPRLLLQLAIPTQTEPGVFSMPAVRCRLQLGSATVYDLLYERHGEWNGRQIVPFKWVEISIRPHIKDVSPDDPNDNLRLRISSITLSSTPSFAAHA